MVLGTLVEAGLALLAVLLAAAFGVELADEMRFSWRAVGLGIVVCLPMLALLLITVHFPVGPLHHMRTLFRDQIAPLFATCRWYDMLWISVLAGVGEELLFRGALQLGLAGVLGPAGALLAASAVFGICHWLSAFYAFLAMLIGTYLGAIVMHGGGLTMAMTAHAVYDFVALLYLTRWSRREGVPPGLPADLAAALDENDA
jgi:membrane protease YdiL (CAAX protease family)